MIDIEIAGVVREHPRWAERDDGLLDRGDHLNMGYRVELNITELEFHRVGDADDRLRLCDHLPQALVGRAIVPRIRRGAEDTGIDVMALVAELAKRSSCAKDLVIGMRNDTQDI